MKKALSILLSVLILVACMPMAFAADATYQIVSPYEDVIWEGDGAWGAYKGSLHSHTTVSDATEDYPEMIKEFYEQDYDFLAVADHGVTGRAWNEKQTLLPLYLYQFLLGYKMTPLTDEEFYGITGGTYPTYDGTPRGTGMTCVTGANEFNYMTLTKSHVNGYFLEPGVGDGFTCGENSFEPAIAFIEKNGGLSHINHPGDWLDSNADMTNVSKPENVEFFADILLRYKSCLGMEVFNENNGTTGYDRILWDNLLMTVLPYGRTVIGFSNTDAHDKNNVDTSFSIFMMEENTSEKVKETMQSGSFFAVTRNLRANNVIGPEKEIDAMNKGLAYPMFTSIDVDGHSVTVNAKDFNKIQWIANGKIIFEQDVTAAQAGQPITLNLDEIDGAEDFIYIRAELIGEGGMCVTQAFEIDDGTQPLEYNEDTDLAGVFEDIWFRVKSSLIYVIFQELYRAIFG